LSPVQLLGHIVRNNDIVRNTGLSFAIAGTGMHFLNIASVTTPQLSHTWSAIAIAGFFLTSLSQMKESWLLRLKKTVRQEAGNLIHQQRAKNDDVALP
jgi:hypothetical protein